MRSNELTAFLRDKIEPLKDAVYGNRYRAAAHLKDGTYLPCVIFQSRQSQVDLALRRFRQLRWRRSQYRAVVASFVSAGSRVADYHLEDVELSPFAWPADLLGTIHGETAMGWTAFVAEMKDGTMHSYGTPFNFEFFDLPKGYSYADIIKLHNGMAYAQSRGLEKFSMELFNGIECHRDRLFFTCYLKELGAAD